LTAPAGILVEPDSVAGAIFTDPTAASADGTPTAPPDIPCLTNVVPLHPLGHKWRLSSSVLP